MNASMKLTALSIVFSAALIGIGPSITRAADTMTDPTVNSTTDVPADSPTEPPVHPGPDPYYEPAPPPAATDSTVDTTNQAAPGGPVYKPENYVVLKGGMYSPSTRFDFGNYNGGQFHDIDSRTGFAGEIAIGRYFLPFLALELGGGYFQSRNSPAAPPGDTMLRAVPLVATGKALLPLGIFEPYGLFGIGLYITDLDIRGNENAFRGSTEVTYGLHAGVGFNINVTDIAFVGLEGKYLWAEPSFGGRHVKLNGFITTLDVGFRF